MKSAVQLRRTDKSASSAKAHTQKCHRSAKADSQADRGDIRYLCDRWYFPSNRWRSVQAIQSRGATGSPILSQFQSVHNFLHSEPDERGQGEQSGMIEQEDGNLAEQKPGDAGGMATQQSRDEL